MSAVPLTFDTLAYVKQLEAVGVPREQAEVQANALRRIIDEKLATKMDIAQVRAEAEANKQELKRDIADVKHDIVGVKRDMLEMENRWMHQAREMESRIIIRLGGMLIAATGVIIAVLKL